MRIEVVTCDGCGRDLTDAPDRWWALGDGGAIEIEGCSAACLVVALAGKCDDCGMVVAPGADSAVIHAEWHVRNGHTPCGHGSNTP